ncbi:MAG: DUF4128 domain-containing protein, partial [Lentisphaeraceae bacterium]|nr:DUF4128 domain-containing protein [Lentisphaeraceae bacterium]
MTVYSDVEKGLLQSIVAFLTANTIDSETQVQTENRDFDPSGNDLFIKLTYIPNRPEAVTAGTAGFDRLTGFYQIDFNIPLGEGVSRLRSLEDSARSYFWSGRSISYGSAVMTITRAGFNTGQTVNGFHRRSL